MKKHNENKKKKKKKQNCNVNALLADNKQNYKKVKDSHNECARCKIKNHSATRARTRAEMIIIKSYHISRMPRVSISLRKFFSFCWQWQQNQFSMFKACVFRSVTSVERHFHEFTKNEKTNKQKSLSLAQ